jgi:hypothetical protein
LTTNIQPSLTKNFAEGESKPVSQT